MDVQETNGDGANLLWRIGLTTKISTLQDAGHCANSGTAIAFDKPAGELDLSVKKLFI